MMKKKTQTGSQLLLFFDTETTGLPSRDRKIRSDPFSWPRLVEIGWIVCTENGVIIDEQSHIIDPQGFDIPDAASAIHGITTRAAGELGHPVQEILTVFCTAVMQADILIAHNLSYDIRIVLTELIRIGKREMLPKRPGICTMRSSARFCAIPGKCGKGFKWPALSVLHNTLMGTPPPSAHRALTDARSCAACYHELIKRGVKMDVDVKIDHLFSGHR